MNWWQIGGNLVSSAVGVYLAVKYLTRSDRRLLTATHRQMRETSIRILTMLSPVEEAEKEVKRNDAI